MRYTTLADVIDQAIVPALGEYGSDYDIEAIARETHTWVIDTDSDGNELLNTGGFEQTVSDDEFWAIAEKHDTSA
ncbi:hypothetical protein JJV70_02120 [Streptomyces sp. JJ66]|uniref:hypothetical protein n=1 Tax=Streptomyces sp. JJ66 TaxID=2803843 RepID=UPI001C571741|nr:hypothetical protein [Streptomyces sp. JJ66]MBW1600917.1 hypothetical protein [Streptomyces sp. JJ66]